MTVEGAVRATVDIGAALKVILEHPDEFSGQSVTLGDSLISMDEQAAIIERVSGKKARAVQPMTPDALPLPVRNFPALSTLGEPDLCLGPVQSLQAHHRGRAR